MLIIAGYERIQDAHTEKRTKTNRKQRRHEEETKIGRPTGPPGSRQRHDADRTKTQPRLEDATTREKTRRGTEVRRREGRIKYDEKRRNGGGQEKERRKKEEVT